MKAFQVNDMTCGHCVNAVMKAVKRVDPSAYVSVDLTTKRVEVDSRSAGVKSLQEAIIEAGYTPVVAEAAAARPTQAASRTGCCGSCH